MSCVLTLKWASLVGALRTTLLPHAAPALDYLENLRNAHVDLLFEVLFFSNGGCQLSLRIDLVFGGELPARVLHTADRAMLQRQARCRVPLRVTTRVALRTPGLSISCADAVGNVS